MNDSAQNWRWVILSASFSSLLVNASMNNHVGVLNIAMLDRFKSDPDLTAWLLSLYTSTLALAAPIASVMVNLTNCRICVFLSGVVSFIGFVSSSFVNEIEWFFLTITLAGLGQSLCQVGGTVVLAFYFPSMTSVVTGICLAGCALGSFVHPPLLQLLVDSYGLKWAFAIPGAIALNSCVCGLTFRPTQSEERKSHTQKSDGGVLKTLFGGCFHHLKIFQDPAFSFIVFATFAFSVAFKTVVLFLPEYVVENIGLSHQEASMAAATVGIGSAISRVFVGFAAADLKIGASLMFIGMNAVAFLVCMMSSFLFSFHGGVYIISFSIGVYASATQSLYTPLAYDLVGLEKAASGYGLMLLSFGCGSLVGPPLTGLMFLVTSCLGAVHTFFY